MPKDPARSKPSGLPIIYPYAAGIDIGSRFHAVAVNPDLCDEPVQPFQTFASDLQRMTDWLVATDTQTVVMESTGVYWRGGVLESRGGGSTSSWSAPARRAVSGGESDVNDALRVYLRARERHTDYAAAHILRMQKMLTFMNIQLHHVISR